MFGQDFESRALLIHHHKPSKRLEVTSHPVIPAGESFTLGAGNVFSVADQFQLTNILLNTLTVDIGFIPSHLLAQGPNYICWWAKPRVAEFRYRKEKGGIGSLSMPYPAHIFLWSNRNFFAAALHGSRRPTPVTKLFYSPTMNVSTDSSICQGNTSLKSSYHPSIIPDLENFFYCSTNTHESHVEVIKAEKNEGDTIQFLQELHREKAKSFPKDRLVPLSENLERFVKRRVGVANDE